MAEVDFEAIVDAMRNAEQVVVLTGAGVSAESGIPTFRDALEGYWSKYDAQELATPQAYQRDPELVTRWYDERRMKVMACDPNPGHYALARLEAELTQRGGTFTLLTQNVDGLHVRAGSKNVVEVHGSLTTWRSITNGAEYRDLPEGPFETYPPKAPDGSLMRPGVVWFGEALPEAAVREAASVLSSCDLYLAVGTSGLVYPAAGFIYDARSAGARTVELNLDPTPMTREFDLALRGKSGELLPRLVDALFGAEG